MRLDFRYTCGGTSGTHPAARQEPHSAHCSKPIGTAAGGQAGYSEKVEMNPSLVAEAGENEDLDDVDIKTESSATFQVGPGGSSSSAGPSLEQQYEFPADPRTKTKKAYVPKR